MKNSNYVNNICDDIFNDYIADIKASETDDIINKLPLLIDNNMAGSITGSEFKEYHSAPVVKIMTEFMVKYNKKLKEQFRKITDWEYGGSKNRHVDDNDKLLELSKYALPAGTYYARLKKDEGNFLIFILSEDKEDSEIYNYTLYFIGKKWKKYKEKFEKLNDSYKKISDDSKAEYITYTDDRRPVKKVFKSFEKLIFKDEQKIIDYVDNWVNAIPEFNKYDITPKLSIMIYGEPGTGKSTFAQALAKHLELKRVVNVSADTFSDNNEDDQMRSRYRMPARRSGMLAPAYVTAGVYVIDDIDCVCESRETNQSKENNTTTANLLAYLDNPPTFDFKAKDGVLYPVSIVVATTNYYDRLDDAVKRFGRFDLKFEMTKFERPEAQKMCDIYGLKLEDIVKDSNKKDFTISPSELQAKCLENLDKTFKTV